MMGLKLKEITGREIFEAIEKNGIRVIRDNWIEDKGDNIGACILGIAALNLGVTAASTSGLNSSYPSDIIEGHSLEDQLNRFTIHSDNPWYSHPGEEVGRAIWSRFDEVVDYESIIPEHPDYIRGEYNEDTDEVEDDNYTEIWEKINESLDPTQLGPSSYTDEFYKLSWKDAVKMSREILEPLFDEKFQVAVEDYEELYDWTPPNF